MVLTQNVSPDMFSRFIFVQFVSVKSVENLQVCIFGAGRKRGEAGVYFLSVVAEVKKKKKIILPNSWKHYSEKIGWCLDQSRSELIFSGDFFICAVQTGPPVFTPLYIGFECSSVVGKKKNCILI